MEAVIGLTLPPLGLSGPKTQKTKEIMNYYVPIDKIPVLRYNINKQIYLFERRGRFD